MSDTVKKYLIFSVEQESYGIPITKVQEVIRYMPITRLHEASRFLKGVVNLRGKIIPIIDMRLKFGLSEKPYTDRTVFIIVEILGARDVNHVGLAVDGVKDVVDIPDSSVNRTPEIGFKFKSKYLYGIVQLQDSMVMILNLDSILSTEEVVEIGEQLEATR
jgi:purine-binding chemotaxis protein CheW